MNSLDFYDFLLQSVLAVAALTAMNHFMFHDSMLLAVAYAAAIIASFWCGRLLVRFLRRRKILPGLSGD